jgi:hypothetical protein
MSYENWAISFIDGVGRHHYDHEERHLTAVHHSSDGLALAYQSWSAAPRNTSTKVVAYNTLTAQQIGAYTESAYGSYCPADSSARPASTCSTDDFRNCSRMSILW